VFNHSATHKHFAIILGLILTWVTYAVYGQVRDHEFITFDDYEYVVQNPLVRSGITLQNLGRVFTTVHASNWHPLTWISHMVDAELFGLNPSAHHMSSLVLHILCAVLLFSFLRQATGAVWRSFLAAALFTLHPLHVESVAWVAERKDVLSCAFFLLTLLAYRRYALNPCVKTYALALFLFSLGLMSKPMLVTLPFVLLLLDYWPIGRLDPKNPRAFLVIEKIPFFLFSAAASILTYTVQLRWGAVVEQIPLRERLVNALHSYTVYLFKTFWPHPLSFFYPHPLDSIPLWQSIGSLLLIGSLTWLSIRLFRRLPYLAVGWFWYLGTLLPVIGLIQVGSHAMADRYTYIPHIGLFIVLAWGSAGFLEKRAHLRPVFVALWLCFLVPLSAVTWRQVGHWKNSFTLYRHAIAVTSSNIVAHNNLGNALAREGELDEAEQHLREAIRLNPHDAAAHNNLGNVLMKLGRIEEGVLHYQEALRIKPKMTEARINLDLALQSLSQQRGGDRNG
jgi:hypothetical protein